MSYSEGAEKFYDLFGAKDDAPFYIDLAHVPELKADSLERRPFIKGEPEADPLRKLKLRFVNGEISEKEYLRMKELLEG